jgi:hypothetical protein
VLKGVSKILPAFFTFFFESAFGTGCIHKNILSVSLTKVSALKTTWYLGAYVNCYRYFSCLLSDV